jgi:hypothetical protein
MTLKRGLLIPSLMSIILAITLSQVSLVASSPPDRSVTIQDPMKSTYLPLVWR